MLSREDRVLAELLRRRGILSSEALESAARERDAQAPHLTLSEFLVQEGLIDAATGGGAKDTPPPGRIAEFLLVREIGRGGMGVVYEAIQEPLGRRVALKVLGAGAVQQSIQSERFLREARAIARLRHPNIVAVHSSGESGECAYISMDLVEGPSVESLLEQGPMDPTQAARIARAMADALGAAHEAGLIHRDVKPSNILLELDETPKLTDFGLVHDVTAASLTLPSSVLGTPAFMCPEQARGAPPEPGHDLYSLGAVLYAMLAGRAPYEGNLPSAVLSQVLTEAPRPLKDLRPEVPASLVAICEKALSRSAMDRYQEAAELVSDLDRFLAGERTEAESARARTKRARWIRSGTVLALSVLLLGAGTWAVRLAMSRTARRAAGAGTPRPIKRVTALPGLEVNPTLSPDGSWLAYASPRDGDWDVYLDRTGEGKPLNLTDDHRGVDVQPAFSPDGKTLAFRSDREGGGIFLLDLESRAVSRLVGFGFHPAWSPDGQRIAFSTEEVVGVGRSPRNMRSEVWMVALPSWKDSRLVESDAVQPSWSPDGKRVLFWGTRAGRTGIWWIDLQSGVVHACEARHESPRDPVWSFDGSAIFVTSRRSGVSDLWEIPFDQKMGTCRGDGVAIGQSVSETQQGAAPSRDGSSLALVNWIRRESLAVLGDTRAEGQGASFLTNDSRVESSPDLSPDGQWLVFSIQDGPSDLALVRTDNSDRRSLTNDQHEERTPRWSPDGQWIAFASNRTGNFEIWRMRPDGSGVEMMTRTEGGSALSPVWSPDGRRLAYGVRGAGILAIDPSASIPDEPVILRPADRLLDADAVPRAWSPDGRRLLLVGKSRNASILDLKSGEETPLPLRAQGGAWAGPGELWLTDEGELKALDPATGRSRLLSTVTPRRFSASLSIDPRTGTAYTTVVENEADIWLMDLTQADEGGGR